MTAFWLLTCGTVRELLRTRITVLPVVLFGFAVLATFGVDAGLSGGESADAASSLIDTFAILALLVAAAAGCGQVSEEVDHGTILLLGVRPVRRSTIIAAKLVGAWIYASAALLAWSGAVGGMFAARGMGSEPFLAAVMAGALHLPLVALIVSVAVFASSLLGTRMAFGFTMLTWLVGWFSGQAHQLFAAGEPILAWVEPLRGIVAAMTWIVPLRRLGDWANSMAGTLADNLTSATGTPLPLVYGSSSDALWGMVAIAGWAAAAALVFHLRRSLV